MLFLSSLLKEKTKINLERSGNKYVGVNKREESFFKPHNHEFRRNGPLLLRQVMLIEGSVATSTVSIIEAPSNS
jgi:hypothetical protein